MKICLESVGQGKKHLKRCAMVIVEYAEGLILSSLVSRTIGARGLTPFPRALFFCMILLLQTVTIIA